MKKKSTDPLDYHSVTIFHGDNTVLSRNAFTEFIASSQRKGKEIVRLEGRSLEPTQLSAAIGGASLFGDDRLIIIEQFWKQRSATKRQASLAALAGSPSEVVFWEDKSIPATELKPLVTGKATIIANKTSPIVFSAMDLLGSTDRAKLLKAITDSCTQDSAEFVFAMVVRQVYLLLLAKTNQSLKAAPFIQTKLKRQAGNFTLAQLEQLHQQLVLFDQQQKTSKAMLTTQEFLQLWALKTTH